MSHSKNKQLAELKKQLAEAQKWCKHFNEEGCFDTVHHTNAANLRGAIKALKGNAPKPKRAELKVLGPEEDTNGT